MKPTMVAVVLALGLSGCYDAADRNGKSCNIAGRWRVKSTFKGQPLDIRMTLDRNGTFKNTVNLIQQQILGMTLMAESTEYGRWSCASGILTLVVEKVEGVSYETPKIRTSAYYIKSNVWGRLNYSGALDDRQYQARLVEPAH